MTTKQQTKTGTTPAIEKNTSAKRKILGIVGSALVAAASLGQAACDNTENPAPASKPAEIQKEFKYEIDGIEVTIENQTNSDITKYAVEINKQMGVLLESNNGPFTRALTYFHNNKLNAKVIIENEAGHEYEDNYRVENDGKTMALPFEWLIIENSDNIKQVMRNGFNHMRIVGQDNGLVITPNSRQGFSTRKLTVAEKAIKNANRIVANSRFG